MIEKLFNHPHLLHKADDSDNPSTKFPIAACLDNDGTIILSQEGRDTYVNREAVPELCKLLKKSN